nr:MAG TPA: hypothetical protein [Caudoviricetes sp.]
MNFRLYKNYIQQMIEADLQVEYLSLIDFCQIIKNIV